MILLIRGKIRKHMLVYARIRSYQSKNSARGYAKHKGIIRPEHKDLLSKLKVLVSEAPKASSIVPTRTELNPSPSPSPESKPRFRKITVRTPVPSVRIKYSSPATRRHLESTVRTVNLHLRLQGSVIDHLRSILSTRHPDQYAPVKITGSNTIPLFTQIPIAAIPEVHRIVGSYVLAASPFPIGIARPAVPLNENRPILRRGVGDWVLQVEPSHELVKFWTTLREELSPSVPKKDARGEPIRMFHADDFRMDMRIRMPACRSVGAAQILAKRIRDDFPNGIEIGIAKEIDGFIKYHHEEKPDLHFWNRFVFQTRTQIVDVTKAARDQRGIPQTTADYWATTQWRSTGLESATKLRLAEERRAVQVNAGHRLVSEDQVWRREASAGFRQLKLEEKKDMDEVKEALLAETGMMGTETDREAAQNALEALRRKKLLTIWDLRSLEVRKQEVRKERRKQCQHRRMRKKLRTGFQSELQELRANVNQKTKKQHGRSIHSDES